MNFSYTFYLTSPYMAAYSIFFQIEHGGYIGTLFMSFIHTSKLNRVNPFHYLTTLQRHSSDLFKNPVKWLPWNYLQAATNPL